MAEREIIIGGRYRHVEGTEYTVSRFALDATGWEKTGQLREVVIYVQEVAQEVAGHYPAGTVYTREVKDFLGQTEHEGTLVNTFELIQAPEPQQTNPTPPQQ